MISRENALETKENLVDEFSLSAIGRKNYKSNNNLLTKKRKPKKETSLESKYRIDSLNKKVKAKFFTMLHQTLSTFVCKKLPKIPQSVVTNVSIKFNKELLDKPIKQIYRESVLFPNDDELKNLIPQSKQKDFLDILDTKFSEAFENYLTCPIFKNLLKEISRKNGYKYKDTFEEECKKFVEYYTNSKPRRS